jgi:oxalate decarboxylase/phosphoglucose isomerase-like protein (cupin superfamily)
MTDGLLLPPGDGRRIRTMTLKAGAGQSKIWSVFEADVAPGFDVGAHLHHQAEEVFYVLEGELDLLAFQPAAMASGDWRTWESATGTTVLQGGPGASCSFPLAVRTPSSTPGPEPARVLFLVSPPATRSTSRNSPTCLPPEDHQTKPRSRRYGAPMTFINSRPSPSAR